jgi:hypothetical protein
MEEATAAHRPLEMETAHRIFVIYSLIAMQLLEIIAYGPNTFGTHRKGGGDS